MIDMQPRDMALALMSARAMSRGCRSRSIRFPVVATTNTAPATSNHSISDAGLKHDEAAVAARHGSNNNSNNTTGRRFEGASHATAGAPGTCQSTCRAGSGTANNTAHHKRACYGTPDRCRMYAASELWPCRYEQ